MSFCANCGTKQDVGAKFCSNCGQPAVSAQPSVTNTPPQASKEWSAIGGSVKKELLQLSNIYFSLYTAALFLMKLQVEGGFKSALEDTGDGSTAVFIALLAIVLAAIGLTYFTVRIQGINKGKPGWVLGTLIVIAGLTLMNWTSTNFANFNWADWVSEAIGLVQLYLLYAIYQLLNKAKAE